MRDLLEQDFKNYYNLNVSVSANVVSTNDLTFDLIDDVQIIYQSNNGIAKYANPQRNEVNVINYELFIDSLPDVFKRGKEKCDLIVFTSNAQYFLLNELTDTESQYVLPFTNQRGKQEGKESKAKRQLKLSLTYLITVPTINNFIQQFPIKHCCFFSKQPYIPQQINTTHRLNAIQAFNQQNNITTNGVHLSDRDIENLGFEFWVFSGNQTYLLS